MWYHFIGVLRVQTIVFEPCALSLWLLLLDFVFLMPKSAASPSSSNLAKVQNSHYKFFISQICTYNTFKSINFHFSMPYWTFCLFAWLNLQKCINSPEEWHIKIFSPPKLVLLFNFASEMDVGFETKMASLCATLINSFTQHFSSLKIFFL